MAVLVGTVAVASKPSAGTPATLTLPISIAMTRLLVVRAAEDLYGVPMDHVVETARVAPDRIAPIRAGRAVEDRQASANSGLSAGIRAEVAHLHAVHAHGRTSDVESDRHDQVHEITRIW